MATTREREKDGLGRRKREGVPHLGLFIERVTYDKVVDESLLRPTSKEKEVQQISNILFFLRVT